MARSSMYVQGLVNSGYRLLGRNKSGATVYTRNSIMRVPMNGETKVSRLTEFQFFNKNNIMEGFAYRHVEDDTVSMMRLSHGSQFGTVIARA